MKYISKEQFRNAGEKAVNKIMEWWEPEDGDLVACKVYGTHFLGDALTEEKIWVSFVGDVSIEDVKKDYIPLLTEGKLIKFIEHCTGWPVTIYNQCGWYIVEPMPKEEEEFYSKPEHNADAPKWWLEEKKFLEWELIDALWKCACEVATEAYRKQVKENKLKPLFDVIERLEDAGMLDLEIEVYTNGEYKTVEDLVNSLEDELSYAAECCE